MQVTTIRKKPNYTQHSKPEPKNYFQAGLKNQVSRNFYEASAKKKGFLPQVFDLDSHQKWEDLQNKEDLHEELQEDLKEEDL